MIGYTVLLSAVMRVHPSGPDRRRSDIPLMRVEPLLVRHIEKLIEAVGRPAAAEQVGRFATPLTSWQGRDALDFIDRLRQATADDYMGIGASGCPLGISDFVIELAARCGTLREAVHAAFRLMKIVTGAVTFELMEEGRWAILQISEAPSERDPQHVLADWSMITWHKMPQWLIGSEICLERTEFDHPLDGPYSAYSTMFGSECVFNSDASRLVFAAAYLDRRIIRSGAEGERLKRETAGDLTRQMSISRTWKQVIINMLRAEMAKGHPPSGLEEVAEELGLSSQTLRRRLKVEGASFRSVKAEARMEIALDVLAATGAVGEASIAAGFADTNALSRALKRSRGISSNALREQVRHWGVPPNARDESN
jgi:AraC-like DNA-binding protein